MKRRLFVAFTFVFAVADVSAVSASRAAELQTPVEAFAPMSFLAGSCWKGAFKDRPSVTDEHCFEWVYGGKFLQDIFFGALVRKQPPQDAVSRCRRHVRDVDVH